MTGSCKILHDLSFGRNETKNIFLAKKFVSRLTFFMCRANIARTTSRTEQSAKESSVQKIARFTSEAKRGSEKNHPCKILHDLWMTGQGETAKQSSVQNIAQPASEVERDSEKNIRAKYCTQDNSYKQAKAKQRKSSLQKFVSRLTFFMCRAKYRTTCEWRDRERRRNNRSCKILHDL